MEKLQSARRPEARRSIVADDLAQTVASDVDQMIQGARAAGAGGAPYLKRIHAAPEQCLVK